MLGTTTIGIKTAARGFVYEHSGIVHSPLLLHVITRYLEDQTLGSMCTRHAVTWVANMRTLALKDFSRHFLVDSDLQDISKLSHVCSIVYTFLVFLCFPKVLLKVGILHNISSYT